LRLGCFLFENATRDDKERHRIRHAGSSRRVSFAGLGIISANQDPEIPYAGTMQVVLPEQALPAKLILNPELRMNDDEYYEFCMSNPDVRFERTARGEIVIVPPAGAESDYRNADVIIKLGEWAKRDGRGKVFGATTEFILPNGAALSPDAAWVSTSRLSKLSKDQLRKFPRLIPEFVVEVMSPTDRLRPAMEKMTEWIRGGVQLAWLIHGDEQAVYIYRENQNEAEMRTGITTLAGEGAVAGFDLDLTDIWAGL
jgi:Uma2 family endonuclease